MKRDISYVYNDEFYFNSTDDNDKDKDKDKENNDKKKIRNGYYCDYHGLRPYNSFKKINDEILNLL